MGLFAAQFKPPLSQKQNAEKAMTFPGIKTLSYGTYP